MFKLRITGDLGFEVWQDITGYEGLYQVSTYGRIRSVPQPDRKNQFKEGRILSLRNGRYLSATIYKNREWEQVIIHRIVAAIFIPNFQNKPFIDHIDTNKHNNRVENLRWVTAKENMNNPLTKEVMKHINDGRTASEETKEKLRLSHLGKKDNEQTKKKKSESLRQRYIKFPWLRERSEEQRRKISKALKGKYTGWNATNNKPVKQLTLEGEYIRTFASATEAAEVLGKNRSCIKDCVNGRQKTAYGFMWEFA